MSEHEAVRIVPAGRHRIEIEINRSRFVATADIAETVDAARAFIEAIRNEMPDATHHVYAFRIGHQNSITEGMSDDGEPSGTAGPPALSVLRGTGVGDVAIVITRYFGGTKLGTGGLVRAYSDATREILRQLATVEKFERQTLVFEVSYSQYQIVKNLAEAHKGTVSDEDFGVGVTLTATFPATSVPAFTEAARDATAGKIELITVT